MKKLTSALDDGAKEVEVLSNLGVTSDKLSDFVPEGDRLHASSRRNTESKNRKLIDDLTEARWLRDQLREWDDSDRLSLRCHTIRD